VLSFDTNPGEIAEPNNLACGRCFCLITTYTRTAPIASHVVSALRPCLACLSLSLPLMPLRVGPRFDTHQILGM
jgi:hypothetical protein